MTTAQPHASVARRPPEFVNRTVSALLRSPLHGLISAHMMLLTFTGRKSGRQFTTPVTYAREGDTIHFFSNGSWWKNLEGGAAVTMLVKGRELRGIAEPTQDVTAIVRETRAYLKRHGLTNAYRIGLNLPRDREPTDAELMEIARQRVVIYIKVQGL